LIKLTAIFTAFFRVGSLTLGGGLAMLPFLRRELIAKRGWVSEEEFAAEFAMASSLPGTMVVNLALLCGAKLRGGRGAGAAFLGVVLPPFLIILAVAAFLFPYFKHPSVAAFLRGAAAAVAGLLAHTALSVCKPLAAKAPLLIAAFIGAGVALIPSVNPIFALILVSAAVYLLSNKKHDSDTKGNGGVINKLEDDIDNDNN
jgi:chromate transporter